MLSVKRILAAIAVLISSILSAGVCRAGQDKPFVFTGVEYLTGFGYNDLRQNQGIYNVVPFFLDFDFDIKPLADKLNIHTPGLLQFVEEPFLNYTSRPNNNVEIGNNIAIKFGLLPETSKFQPYIKAGGGIIYITQHVLGQSTQFNFNEYAGLGCHCFVSENTALTAEYRFRHISNASIEHPNSGMNTHFALFGVFYQF
ncbi:MAG: acyloxyacyl hydrolase [Candidatus Omnitrophica bacterium]|nr:acyloxyacyl hydrolase [Candidatus Omnitrophota bacterium]